MKEMVIKSCGNPLVKELSALKEKKFRNLSGTFLVEGSKMVRECIASGLSVKRLILREDYEGEGYALPAVVLGADAFRAVCDAVTPQGIAAEVFLPACKILPPEGSCLLLDGVADPANVGAIIRTAVAAGYGEIYLADCADPFSPKSVRASMSGVFYAHLMRGTRQGILTALADVPLIAADMDGENVFSFSAPQKFALCIGNEGNGLTAEISSRAAYTVKIPMDSRTESLNAAVSAGILMYVLKQKSFK